MLRHIDVHAATLLRIILSQIDFVRFAFGAINRPRNHAKDNPHELTLQREALSKTTAYARSRFITTHCTQPATIQHRVAFTAATASDRAPAQVGCARRAR